MESSTLVVRQVSEVPETPSLIDWLNRTCLQNSKELLGLSAKFLFSLDCFTDTLPDNQADVVWDNIQFLNQSESNPEENEDAPHIFMLTGWGEPASTNAQDRPSWSCWCAVHRPQLPNLSGPGGSRIGGVPGLIILELELERDLLNPHSHSAHLPPPSSHLAGLDGQEQWVPRAEDILDSTISRAKPLLALERLRKMSRSASMTSPTPDDTRSRRRARRGTSNTASTGMMDIFAVMAQVNEQLGAAAELQDLVDIIVGVIKDLTQFHRVMVYKFDEDWNGQVVAELVDWSQTHDLFKGLHFPASDIPSQVSLYLVPKLDMIHQLLNRPGNYMLSVRFYVIKYYFSI